MRNGCFAFGALLVGASLTWAADEPKKKSPANDAPTAESDESNVADQIEAIETEMSEKQRDIVQRYREAEDDDERQKILEEYKKLQAAKTDKYAEVAEKHPNDEQIGELCQQLVARGAPAEKLFRVLVKKSKSRDIKGLATLGLGQVLSERSNDKDIDHAQRERLRKEAKESLRAVVHKYADVELGSRKLGDLAGGALFELEHLAVGLPVPDLQGEDLEGAKFKLSDYRGKVVFLDFWAHW